jgi:hypothetical protein
MIHFKSSREKQLKQFTLIRPHLSVLRYSVDPGETGIAVGCIARLRPGGLLKRDDIEVRSFEQLHCGLTLSPSDELISNIISIQVSPTNLQETEEQLVNQSIHNPVL